MTEQDLLDLHERISSTIAVLQIVQQQLDVLDSRLRTVEQLLLLKDHQANEASHDILPFPPKDLA